MKIFLRFVFLGLISVSFLLSGCNSGGDGDSEQVQEQEVAENNESSQEQEIVESDIHETTFEISVPELLGEYEVSIDPRSIAFSINVPGFYAVTYLNRIDSDCFVDSEFYFYVRSYNSCYNTEGENKVIVNVYSEEPLFEGDLEIYEYAFHTGDGSGFSYELDLDSRSHIPLKIRNNRAGSYISDLTLRSDIERMLPIGSYRVVVYKEIYEDNTWKDIVIYEENFFREEVSNDAFKLSGEFFKEQDSYYYMKAIHLGAEEENIYLEASSFTSEDMYYYVTSHIDIEDLKSKLKIELVDSNIHTYTSYDIDDSLYDDNDSDDDILGDLLGDFDDID